MEKRWNNIYDFEQDDVIMHDIKCTRKQAQNHIKAGAVVLTPEEFIENLVDFFEMNFFSAEDQKEFLEDSYNCETLEELKSIVEQGKLHTGDTTNGFYEGYPYVIEYCL